MGMLVMGMLVAEHDLYLYVDVSMEDANMEGRRRNIKFTKKSKLKKSVTAKEFIFSYCL